MDALLPENNDSEAEKIESRPHGAIYISRNVERRFSN